MPLGLMVSGGGAKGAFACGAVQYLTEQGVRPDLCAGTSTGSIVVTGLVAGKEAALREYYATASTAAMLTRNALNDVVFANAEALFGIGPLQERLGEIFDAAAAQEVLNGRVPIFLTAVSLQQGDLVYFHTLSAHAFPAPGRQYLLENREQLIAAILASSAVPVSIPPQSIPIAAVKSEQFVDGGVKEYSPLRVLLAAGATEVIAIVLRPQRARPANTSFKSAIAVGLRSIDLLSDDVGENDLAAVDANVPVTIIRPDKDLLPGDSLEFSPAQMQTMTERGYERAELAWTRRGQSSPVVT